MTGQRGSEHSYSPLAHACPVCNAKPGEPCKNRTRSYRRGWPLEHPHHGRVKWARAIIEGSDGIEEEDYRS